MRCTGLIDAKSEQKYGQWRQNSVDPWALAISNQSPKRCENNLPV